MRSNNHHRRGRTNSSTALKEDMATVVRDLRGLVNDGLEAARTRTHEAVDTAKERAVAARERLGEIAGERPLTTIAVSAVAGVVAFKMLGWMMRRHTTSRRSDDE